jgi:serine/threonine-protein kinase RsbW
MAVRDTFIISSELTQIGDARRWATGHASDEGLSEEEVWAIELALAEVLANVMRHAYDSQPGHEIRLSLMIDDEKLELEVQDFADPFQRDSIPPADLDTPRTGGYGLYIIEELMDEVIYSAADNGGHIRMVKRRHA